MYPRKSKSFRLSRRRRHRGTMSSLTLRRATRFLKNVSNIDGVLEISLTPLTQKFVECDIGNKVTLVSPWIFVDKEKIETHLDYYQTESCFYPIKEVIAEFPKNEILVGTFSCVVDKPAPFFICSTLYAEEQVLFFVEQQKIHIMKMISKMQTRAPEYFWPSLGSEQEIDAEHNLNLRHLYIVDVHAIILINRKTKFKMFFAEDLLNGYVELLPGRNIYYPILKKRLDTGIQCGSIQLHKSVQCDVGCLQDRSTEYCYQYPEIDLTIQLSINMRNFLQVIFTDVCSNLDTNNQVSLETNDYQNLVLMEKMKNLHRPISIKTYKEIVHCTGKKVSCFSWNALISGIVAAAYATNPLFYILKEPIDPYAPEDPAREDIVALIWDYKNNVNPRLYLHGPTEITSLSFCPYNKNILVAGYTSGQIAVWDLTESFKFNKPKKYLTMSEQNNYMEIAHMTTWMKKPIEDKHIYPTITSLVKFGHTSPVTSIFWTPPETFNIDTSKDYKMKFVTSELNGNNILVWVLDTNVPYVKKVKTKPEALTRGISKLKNMQAYFTPSSRLYLTHLSTTKNISVLKMILGNDLYNYEPENPDTLGNLNEGTIFSASGLMHPLTTREELLYTSGLGVLQFASCTGSNYANENCLEICKIDSLEAVHDGPILGCEINAFFPNVILTVGGTVFAIWDCTKLRGALLWRKSKLRYLNGMWCHQFPLSLMVIRSDRYFEFWNFSENTRAPLQIFKYKGNEPINFYGDTNRFHVRKNTFIIADNVGSFMVLLLPSDTIKQEEITAAEEILEDMVNLKKWRKDFTLKFSKISKEVKEIIVEETVKLVEKVEAPPAEVKEVLQPTRAARYQKKLEQHGLSILLGLKGINSDKLKVVKLPIIDYVPEEILRLELEQKSTTKAKKIEQIKERIQMELQKSYPRRRELKLSMSQERAQAMKKQFVIEYKQIEKEVLVKLNRKKTTVNLRNYVTHSLIDIYQRKHREETLSKSNLLCYPKMFKKLERWKFSDI